MSNLLRLTLYTLLCVGGVAGQTCPDGSNISTCISNINTAAHALNRTFLPDSFNLTTYLNVTFNAPEEEFEVCCKTFTFPAKNFSLDPLNPDQKAAHTQSANAPTLSYGSVSGKHTLVMVDPDVPSSTVGTLAKPLLHMLVLNIPDGNVPQGQIIARYNGPMPPDASPHYYFFMILSHVAEVDNSTIPQYSNGGNLSCGVPGRCLFDVKKFISDNSMSLVGLSWMRVSNDIFVNFKNMQSGRLTEAQVCANEPTYQTPCPDCLWSQQHTLGELGTASTSVTLA
ncbi:uncharacterized protein LOC106176833 [Lingula anatina]|uniref:Uncharacterized protein LOC106176833 n=1 Tax=Lingula anatina TaxID=7574 RepID=A0A1S3JWZ6_LINAN|nr:uncharacterized protein LOC106176833 [Lingula anatina]|eukprot:XP_013414832.1 uncharacterized protein LOC106176833 [Lingula anatina]